MPSSTVIIFVVEEGYMVKSAFFSKMTSPVLCSMRIADVQYSWSASSSSGCVSSYGFALGSRVGFGISATALMVSSPSASRRQISRRNVSIRRNRPFCIAKPCESTNIYSIIAFCAPDGKGQKRLSAPKDGQPM